MNILFVSIAFPPKRDPESLQVLKYYSELKKHNDLSISVVTSSNPTLFMEEDKSLRNEMIGYDQLIEVKIQENKYVNFLKRKINSESLNYPDSKFRFHKQSKIVMQTLKVVPDVIYSRSFPLSSTFMAYELAKFYDKPWVLHLSDPWTFKSKNETLSDSQKWNLEHEEMFFKQASRVCLTSLKTIAYYQSKYPEIKGKFFFSPNVYSINDVVDKPVLLREEKQPLKFIYTGGLTKERNPRFILEGIKELEREIENLNSLFEFSFIGPKDSYVSSLMNEFKLSSVKFIDAVSFGESKTMQLNADVLVLIDSPITGNHPPVFFPSKILDYMITRNPILAITPATSTTNEVVNQFGLGICFDYNEIREFKTFLKQCVTQKFDLKGIQTDFPEDFDAKINADRLYNLFLQVHGSEN